MIVTLAPRVAIALHTVAKTLREHRGNLNGCLTTVRDIAASAGISADLAVALVYANDNLYSANSSQPPSVIRMARLIM